MDCRLFALLFLLLLSPAAFGADEPKKLGDAVEKDQRVQADGKAWRLDMAKVVDKDRPRVLLIGDSILNGYLKQVTKDLQGKVYVDAWVNPHCQSEHFNKLLGEVLEQGPYDVVHINMGLHGWQPGRIKEGKFEPLTKGFVETIREKNPNAKIIWASTTPVTKKKLAELDDEINPIIIEHNAMAEKVMKEMNVPINDFYGLVAPQLKLSRGDGFHWQPEGYKLMADMVSASILRELSEKKTP